MHTRAGEECGTNVASENSLSVWTSSGLCIFPEITITYTKRVMGDICVFHQPQNASCPGDLEVVALGRALSDFSQPHDLPDMLYARSAD